MENVVKLKDIRDDAKDEAASITASDQDKARAFNTLFELEGREAFFSQIEYYLTQHAQGPRYDRAHISSIDFHARMIQVWFSCYDDFNLDNVGEFTGTFHISIETPNITSIWNMASRLPSRQQRKLQLLARTIGDQLKVAKELDIAGFEHYVARLEADLASVSNGQLPHYEE